MATIIAGNFPTSVQADRAVQALRSAGFGEREVTVFANNPPGQHDAHPIGGDEHADPEARGAGRKALAGAAVGAAIGAGVGAVVGGPLGAAAGAGLGGLGGAGAGAMGGLGDPETGDQQVRRPAGTIVAVKLGGTVTRETAVEAMCEADPLAVEEAEGDWQDGQWVDFDPVARPRIVWQASPGA